MSWIERLTASLRTRKLEQDLEKELAFHLDMRVREKIAAGATPEDAQREVLRRFGSVTRTKEGCREQSTLGWLAAVRQDLRYAARNLRKNPGFTAAAVACLAIGIGANTVVFSFVNAFLFQPTPAGVVRVGPVSGTPISYLEYRDWQRLNHVFDSVFAYSPGELFAVGRGVDTQHVLGETIAGDYFRTLGATAALGRLLSPSDELQPLAVIGYQCWRDRFHSDPAIAGKSIWIDRQPFTIVGVAAAGFHGMMAPWSTDVWATAALRSDRLPDRRNGWLAVGAHLKSGVTPRQAAVAMNTLDAELARLYPLQRSAPDRIAVQRPGLSSSPVWSVFLVISALLMAVVGIIYLIACANVAGLLIARAAARRREILIRLSLGVSRGRLVRQLLTESLLLGLLAAAAGTVLAYAAGNALAAIFPQSISHGFQFQHAIDRHVLAWTLALAVASVLFAGLLPSLRASDQNLAAAGRTHTASGGRTPRLRQLLIVAQVAASVLVLATAGVFIRSFQKTQALNPGFDTAHLLTVEFDRGDRQFSFAQTQDFYRQASNALGELPGVESFSLAVLLPLGNEATVHIPQLGQVATSTVDAGYFQSMGIPLLRGHQPHDDEPAGAIVNQALADRLWPNQDPIGKSLLVEKAQLPVVAVAANSRYWSLTEAPRPFVYQVSTPFRSWPPSCLVIRTKGPAANFAAQVSQAIQRLNPDLPAIAAETGQQRLRMWLEPQRAAALLLGTLGFAALSLAITGLYALLAQLLVQRTPEIAVRVVLGASRSGVLSLLLRQSAILVAAGAAVGIAASAGVARLLSAGIGAIGELDAATLLAIVTLLTAVSGAATAIPAYRALRIDPASALRSE
jgi:predicted permease